MSDSDHLFLEALHNAVAAGQMSPEAEERVRCALYEHCPGCDELFRKEDGHECDNFVCPICKRDCRDAFGTMSRACRADYNAD